MLKTLGNFEMFPITLKPAKIHVLNDSLPRAPDAKEEIVVDDIKILYFCIDRVISIYQDDQLFGLIGHVVKKLCPLDSKEKFKLEMLAPMNRMQENQFSYNEKTFASRN